MERSILHKGKAFIKEGEENGRAYVIQTGLVRSFRTISGSKVVFGEYGPGTIIGEASLFVDEPADISFEAMVDTSVISITRQDFQKKLQKTDKMVGTVMDHLLKKIGELNRTKQDEVLSAAEIDNTAYTLVQSLIANVREDKKRKYELAIMPHVNGLIKALRDLKSTK